MTHPRAVYRTALREAFAASPELAGVAVLRGWSMPRNQEDLPALAVVTPRERIELDTGSTTERTAEIVVVLKATGGDDIEDVLDAYSETIETEAIAVFQALDQEPPMYGVTLIDMNVDGEGSTRVGLLEMRFEAMRFAREGAQT